MLPSFNRRGCLPDGIHPATVDEVVERFGHGSDSRVSACEELVEFVAWARRAGVARLALDGSFVTNKVDPNDVDLVILPGPDYPGEEDSATEGSSRWPFLQIIVAASPDEFLWWSSDFFASDQASRRKGVVEIIL